MCENAPIDLLRRQVAAIEVEHGPRGDVRKGQAQSREQIENPRIERKPVQRHQVLDLLAATCESWDVLTKQSEQRLLGVLFRSAQPGCHVGRTNLLLENP